MAAEDTGRSIQLDLILHKKLLNLFQVGDFYYYIFNFQNYTFDLLSNEVESILGYPPSDFDLQFFMDKMHPDDRPWFLNFENKVVEFLATLPLEKLTKYKARYDFRLRKKDGSYIRILHQVMIIEYDETGRILRTMGVHTDISHLKMSGNPVCSIIGMDGEPSYHNIAVDNVFTVSKAVLSKREKQVLCLMIEGNLSKEISELLHISKLTVDKHRKNMIKKGGVNNAGELIAHAVRQGWV